MTLETPRPFLDAVRSRPGGRSADIRRSVLKAVRELLGEHGYGALSPGAVAARAGVDRTTVYRRWPTRARLAADALLDLAELQIPMPDTGDLRKDLRRIARAVARQLSKPSVVALAGALVIASTEDAELSGFIEDFWQARFRAVGNVIRRALAPGEAVRGTDPDQALERLVAPLYFRAIITSRPIDNQLIELCVGTVIADFR
jgi:AcrR family transcriptional regulator